MSLPPQRLSLGTDPVFSRRLLGFAGTLLLPIDIAQAYNSDGRSHVLEGFWAFVYWTTFILTWLVLPFLQVCQDVVKVCPRIRESIAFEMRSVVESVVVSMEWLPLELSVMTLCMSRRSFTAHAFRVPLHLQEYSAAGQFTVRGKAWESVHQNLKFYAALAVCGIAFLIYLLAASGISASDLPAFVFTLATTFGLLNIVVMLGYGLVEVPRLVWRMSDPEAALRRERFKAPDLDQEVFDSVCAVAEVIAEVRQALLWAWSAFACILL